MLIESGAGGSVRSGAGIGAGQKRPPPPNPPPPPKIQPYKTHLAYVKERRSEAEAKAILAEALKMLRTRRKHGEVIY